MITFASRLLSTIRFSRFSRSSTSVSFGASALESVAASELSISGRTQSDSFTAAGSCFSAIKDSTSANTASRSVSRSLGSSPSSSTSVFATSSAACIVSALRVRSIFSSASEPASSNPFSRSCSSANTCREVLTGSLSSNTIGCATSFSPLGTSFLRVAISSGAKSGGASSVLCSSGSIVISTRSGALIVCSFIPSNGTETSLGSGVFLTSSAIAVVLLLILPFVCDVLSKIGSRHLLGSTPSSSLATSESAATSSLRESRFPSISFAEEASAIVSDSRLFFEALALRESVDTVFSAT